MQGDIKLYVHLWINLLGRISIACLGNNPDLQSAKIFNILIEEELLLKFIHTMAQPWINKGKKKKKDAAYRTRNHRITVVGHDLWRQSSSSTLCRAWATTVSCSGQCPGVFWTTARMENPQPLHATCLCLMTLTVKILSFFLLFKQNFLCFSLC